MQDKNATLCRRAFLSRSAALAGSSLMPGLVPGAPAAERHSNFNGVQIGVITFSYRSLPCTSEDLLKYITDCGISSIELMGDSAERFAGAPAIEKGTKGRGKALLDWQLSASMERFKVLRKMYNDAGVNIHIVRFGGIGNPRSPDAQIEYYFRVAKALGARGITRELSELAAPRLGPIADKYEIMIAFHNHTKITPSTYDGEILSHGKYLGINLDIGHYVAGTNCSPIPLIEKHCDRILSLHIKDRKVNMGRNMPLGQGDTPVALVLQYMKRNKLTFPADIEMEYEIPDGSDAVQEVRK